MTLHPNKWLFKVRVNLKSDLMNAGSEIIKFLFQSNSQYKKWI